MEEITPLDSIKTKIHTIRGKQVLLDRDLAELYEVPVKQLNRTFKRNMERFPEDFCFQLNKDESANLRCQIDTSNLHGGRRYLPYAFTEQGVAMLSGILRSEKAVKVNIKIMRAFVSMRRFLSENSQFFQKFQQIDQKLLEHDNKLEKVFKALETENTKQGIFFNGQVFDAYKFICDLIRTAKKRIILIDNYAPRVNSCLFCGSFHRM